MPICHIVQETTEDLEIKGSRSQQRSITDHPLLSDCIKTQQNKRLGSFRTPEERSRRTLITSWTLDFQVFGRFLNCSCFTRLQSADRKRGQRKGATSKNVKKNRQKVSKYFSTLFDIFRAGQKTSKIGKKCQNVFRHFLTFFAHGKKKTSKIVKKCQKSFRQSSHRHQFSGPFCQRLWYK